MTKETLLTLRDVTERLNVSERTVYRYVQERRLPYIRICRRIRFRPESIDQFLRETEVQPLQSTVTT